MSNNYFKDAARLSELAKTHTEKMDKLYGGNTEYSTACTIIGCKQTIKNFYPMPETKVPEIIITNGDSVRTLIAYKNQGYYPVVLNFASFKEPGGKFFEGSSAQEESLCHASNLYNILSNFDDLYYKKNRKNLNRGMYEDRGLYSPYVTFLETTADGQEKPLYADVLTVAAPNMKAGEYSKVSKEENSAALDSRIEFVLKFASFGASRMDQRDNRYLGRVLILGAFGCGVFKQDPYEVASLFLKHIKKGYAEVFDKVVFAIPGGDNLNAFYEVFSSERLF